MHEGALNVVSLFIFIGHYTHNYSNSPVYRRCNWTMMTVNLKKVWWLIKIRSKFTWNCMNCMLNSFRLLTIMDISLQSSGSCKLYCLLNIVGKYELLRFLYCMLYWYIFFLSNDYRGYFQLPWKQGGVVVHWFSPYIIKMVIYITM